MSSWLAELPAGSSDWHSLPITTDVRVDAFVCRGAEPGPIAVITAGIHGDEYEGPAAVIDLTRQLKPADLHGTVVAVPVANPRAVAAGTRTNPEDGKNLARCFPGDVDGSPTERLAAGSFQRLIEGASYLIDLHSGGVEYLFQPLCGFYGPARLTNPSFAAARHFGLPTLWALPPTAGVLSYEAHRRGCVAIGAEYRGAGQLDSEGRKRYLSGIFACLAYWGLLSNADLVVPDAAGAYEGDWQLASAEGLVDANCRLGEFVSAGRLLVRIVDYRGQTLQQLTAPRAGRVLGLRSKAHIRAGDWAVLLGHPAGGLDA